MQLNKMIMMMPVKRALTSYYRYMRQLTSQSDERVTVVDKENCEDIDKLLTEASKQLECASRFGEPVTENWECL